MLLQNTLTILICPQHNKTRFTEQIIRWTFKISLTNGSNKYGNSSIKYCCRSQIFAKVDPLPIDNDSEKKELAKKI